MSFAFPKKNIIRTVKKEKTVKIIKTETFMSYALYNINRLTFVRSFLKHYFQRVPIILHTHFYKLFLFFIFTKKMFLILV